MEIKQILGEGYEVFSLKDLDIHTEIAENGTSFEEKRCHQSEGYL